MSILSEDEMQTVIHAFLMVRHPEPAPEPEIVAVVSDAESMRVSAALLEMLLRGEVEPNYIEGEVVYRKRGGQES